MHHLLCLPCLVAYELFFLLLFDCEPMELCCNAKKINFFIVVVHNRPIYLCGTIPILMICCISEIVRASGLAQGQNFVDHERMEHGSPLRSGGGVHSNGGLMELEGWSGLQTEVIFHIYWSCFMPWIHLEMSKTSHI